MLLIDKDKAHDNWTSLVYCKMVSFGTYLHLHVIPTFEQWVLTVKYLQIEEFCSVVILIKFLTPR